MKKLFLTFASILFALPGISQEMLDTLVGTTEYIKGGLPAGDEEIYQTFIDIITDKEAKEKLAKRNLSHWNTTEVTFDLECSKRGTFPALLSFELYEPTEALESRFLTFKRLQGKSTEENDKMLQERFYQQQDAVKAVYEKIQTNNSPKEYLILVGVVNTDKVDSYKREKRVYLIDPRYPDREWRIINIDPFVQKRVALTLVANDGVAYDFLDSDKDLTLLSEKYDDPLIKFVLEPLYETNPFDPFVKR